MKDMNERNELFIKETKERLLNEIAEIKKEHIYDYCDVNPDFLQDYRNTNYICDCISYQSDDHIDIYTSDLFDWASNNYEYVNDALKEFGYCDDIIQAIRQGQYLFYSEQYYSALDDSVKLYAFNYLIDNELLINNDVLDELLTELSTIDNNNKLSDIEYICDNYASKEY